MFELKSISATDKPTLYAELAQQAQGLLHGERDLIANAANLSALLYHNLPDVNWVGFYFLKEVERDEDENTVRFAGAHGRIRRAKRRPSARAAATRWSRGHVSVPDLFEVVQRVHGGRLYRALQLPVDRQRRWNQADY